MQAYSDNSLMDKAPLLPLSEHEISDLARLRKKRRVRRFGHALVSTACLAFLVYLVSRSSTGHFRWGKCGEHGVHEMGQNVNGLEYAIPKNLDLVHCVDTEEWNDSNVQNSTQDLDFHYTSEASFDLPVSSDTLFLISRGHNLGGIVNVVTSDEQAKDFATVLISLRYNDNKARDSTKVCLLSREENETGLGVFTPIWRGGRHSDRRNHRVNYRITVVLPASEESPLHIKDLETDLPNTSHRFEDLSKVSFDRISLRATNGPVDFESLATRTGSIVTTNGGITGTLSSSFLWTLSSTNGPIKVNVNLTSTEGSNATFIAHTTNAPIKASLNLISSSGTGGTFYVSTTTTNSPLHVEFPTSSVGSILNLKASTTNGPAVVSLDAAYEGAFDLRTSSFFRPRLQIKGDIKDPAGRGRRRVVHSQEVRRGEIAGEIVWGDEPQAKGAVVVSTTNSPVSLEA